MSQAEQFNSPLEYRHAFDRLLGGTHRHLRIYDQDLRELLLDMPQRNAALRAFALHGPQRRIDILLRNWAWVRDHMPGMMGLMEQLGHIITIRQEESIDEPPMECFCAGDSTNILIRPHRDGWRSLLHFDNPLATQPHVRNFDLIWQRAEGPLSYKPLGL